MPNGYVYILGSDSGTLYIGVTSNITLRIYQHRHGILSGFASIYGCHRLLLLEQFEDIRAAIAREKQIKRWRREKKLDLIRLTNPEFKDLAEKWEWPKLLPGESIAKYEKLNPSRTLSSRPKP